ncbi:MAG: 30S ribosomal protein S13 [Desulfobacterales bacterium]|nr:30S ribosomal protein S13 [Desulfobacterales bacterium]MBF0396467.1 30S ribosomal protein S13 [Desulfobacterales bacterium]
MARIAGVDLPKNKQVGVGLSYIYGIGRSNAKKILETLQINLSKKIGDLTDNEVANIRKAIDTECKVEGELKAEISMNIKRLMDLGCYRGLRHRKSLPVHGQRTHTNARTRKGPRKTAVKKKEAAKKK